MRCFALVVLLACWPQTSLAGGRISTFMEGIILEKTVDQWVVATNEGTYWIKMSRPLSWVRRNPGTRISFWVRLDQITRFRPLKLMPSSASAR